MFNPEITSGIPKYRRAINPVAGNISGLLSKAICASFCVVASLPASAAFEGNLDELELSLAPGLNQLSVISEDGQTYSRFKAGSEINLGGHLEIKMGNLGRIRSWSIYWGQCNDDDCNKFIGNALLEGDSEGDAKHVDKAINFPLKADVIPGGNGTLNPNPTAAQIISKCNQLAENSTANQTHIFSQSVPVSVGVDTYVQVQADEAVAHIGPFQTTDIDHAKTINVTLPIKCEPLQSTPEVVGDMKTEMPELELIAADLKLQLGQNFPASSVAYSGSCPMGITLHVGATTNIKGKVSGYVQHKSADGEDWQSNAFTMTTGATEGSHWKMVWTDLQKIPFANAGIPLNSASGGVVNNQPGSGLQFNPGGGSSGGLDPAGSVVAGNHELADNRHIGHFRYVAYTGKTVLPIGPDGSAVTAFDDITLTPWRKYDVTCEPEQSGVATTTPTGVVDPEPPQHDAQSDSVIVVAPTVSRRPLRVSPERLDDAKSFARPKRVPKKVVVCKNGNSRGNACVCRSGWRREKISRIEYVCKKMRPQLVCIGGSVKSDTCVCPRGASRIKIGPHRWGCKKRAEEARKKAEAERKRRDAAKKAAELKRKREVTKKAAEAKRRARIQARKKALAAKRRKAANMKLKREAAKRAAARKRKAASRLNGKRKAVKRRRRAR